MTGITDLSIAENLIRMINLVSFDVCDVNKIRIIREVSPLNYIISCPLVDAIPKELHPHLRRALKREAKSFDVLLGRVTLGSEVRISVYKKVLRSPAYVHGESPHDSEL